MSALREVSCERISALDAGELFAGLVGSKGMIARRLRFRQNNVGKRMVE
jgi:hypothetical protein